MILPYNLPHKPFQDLAHGFQANVCGTYGALSMMPEVPEEGP